MDNINKKINIQVNTDASGNIKKITDETNNLANANESLKQAQIKARQELTNAISVYGANSEQAKKAGESLASLVSKLYDVENANSKASQSTKSLRGQYADARAELNKMIERYGESSSKTIEAARNAAVLSDRIGDQRNLIAAFNPDAKFDAFSKSIGGVAAGFSVLQGAYGAFGQESKNIELALLKVQSAMAISSGLQQVGESIDSFKQLGLVLKQNIVVTGILNFIKTGSVQIQRAETVSTVAQTVATNAQTTATLTSSNALKIFRASMIATGVGAFVIALVALWQNFDKVKEAVYNLVPWLETVGEFLGNVFNMTTDFIGITSDSTRALDKLKANTDKNLYDMELSYKYNYNKYDEYTQKRKQLDIDYMKNKKEILDNEKLTEDERNKRLIMNAEWVARERVRITKEEGDKKKKIDEDLLNNRRAISDQIKNVDKTLSDAKILDFVQYTDNYNKVKQILEKSSANFEIEKNYNSEILKIKEKIAKYGSNQDLDNQLSNLEKRFKKFKETFKSDDEIFQNVMQNQSRNVLRIESVALRSKNDMREIELREDKLQRSKTFFEQALFDAQTGNYFIEGKMIDLRERGAVKEGVYFDKKMEALDRINLKYDLSIEKTNKLLETDRYTNDKQISILQKDLKDKEAELNNALANVDQTKLKTMTNKQLFYVAKNEDGSAMSIKDSQVIEKMIDERWNLYKPFANIFSDVYATKLKEGLSFDNLTDEQKNVFNKIQDYNAKLIKYKNDTVLTIYSTTDENIKKDVENINILSAKVSDIKTQLISQNNTLAKKTQLYQSELDQQEINRKTEIANLEIEALKSNFEFKRNLATEYNKYLIEMENDRLNNTLLTNQSLSNFLTGIADTRLIQTKRAYDAILLITKGLAIADVWVTQAKSVNTLRANFDAIPYWINTPTGVPIPNPIKAPAAAVLAKDIGMTRISAGLATATILAQTLLPKSSGGGGGSSAGGGGGGAAASFNIVGKNDNNILAATIASKQNQAIKTYVIGSDVTTQQAIDRNKVTNATFL